VLRSGRREEKRDPAALRVFPPERKSKEKRAVPQIDTRKKEEEKKIGAIFNPSPKLQTSSNTKKKRKEEMAPAKALVPCSEERGSPGDGDH